MGEWKHLEAVAQSGPVRYGMAGTERALLYRLALETALRSNEIRSLTRVSMRLDEHHACVVVAGRSTKNREAARQFVGEELAQGLREYVATKLPGSALFKMPHPSNVVRMLRADLAEARKQWIRAAGDDVDERLRREQSDFLAERNEAGEVFDFHSLRHTTGTWLAQAKESPKTIQTVMRHSVVTLSLDTYGHLLPGEEAAAVGKLAELMAQPQVEREALRMTGTDGGEQANAQRQAQRVAQKTGGRAWRGEAGGGEASSHQVDLAGNANALPSGTYEKARRSLAKRGEMSLSGLEPETYGLKVRCSTN